MASPTNVNFDDLLPAAKPDAFNVEWQATAPVPDPNSPGQTVRELSACYRTPQVGGAIILTADYQLGDVDSGRTFIANSSAPILLTLPPVPPVLFSPQGIWTIRVKNLGTGDLTIDPNGLNLDGLLTPVVLVQNAGFEIDTDGTDYWSYGNFGSGGPGASATSSLFADAETPSGTINSSNTAFTLANSPSGSSLELYLNGDLLTSGTDYTLSGGSITMSAAPTTGDVLLAFYRYGGGSNFVDNETPSGTINSSNTAFTLGNVPNPSSSLELYLNGKMQRAGMDYTLSGAAITMTSAPTTGDILRAFYRAVAAIAYNFSGEETPSGTINSSNTAFALAHSPTPSASLRLFLNGNLLKVSTDYTISGAAITMTTAPTTGDSLYAFYRF